MVSKKRFCLSPDDWLVFSMPLAFLRPQFFSYIYVKKKSWCNTFSPPDSVSDFSPLGSEPQKAGFSGPFALCFLLGSASGNHWEKIEYLVLILLTSPTAALGDFSSVAITLAVELCSFVLAPYPKGARDSHNWVPTSYWFP